MIIIVCLIYCTFSCFVFPGVGNSPLTYCPGVGHLPTSHCPAAGNSNYLYKKMQIPGGIPGGGMVTHGIDSCITSVHCKALRCRGIIKYSMATFQIKIKDRRKAIIDN